MSRNKNRVTNLQQLQDRSEELKRDGYVAVAPAAFINPNSGAQVFYGKGEGSEDIAKRLQSALVKNLNIGSKRKCKAGSGIYLMEHTDCPAILIECGFLSNQKEANQLQDKIYQKILCKVIIATISCYINGVDREVLR